MKPLTVIAAVAGVFSYILYLLDLWFPRQISEMPQASAALAALYFIITLIYLVLTRNKTAGIRGIKRWRAQKKIDEAFEASSVRFLIGIVIGIAMYQLLWKNFIN
jgi:drug/metabolite transporter (DMT)-like permease